MFLGDEEESESARTASQRAQAGGACLQPSSLLFDNDMTLPLTKML
jgi:hypothetical protein